MVKKLIPCLFVIHLTVMPVFLKAQNYFQQEVNYVINVKLDDDKHELTADETIHYINNSPDELRFIYIHLWPNAYKDNTTALAKDFLRAGETKFYFSTEKERGYIDRLDFKVEGQSAKWELLKDSIDICKLYLDRPLKSGDSITITTPFHVKIPSGKLSRFGHIGQSYQVTQWYPKPAVYDKNGWNYMPYLNQGEFYSEFGSFDVSITLPKNYVLGATGDITNNEEVEWLNQKVKETEALALDSNKLSDLEFPPSDKVTKTVRYKQSNVGDFAWFCDKRYHVLKGEIATPHTKHKVTTWTMFTDAQFEYWKGSIKYINDAVYYYSLWNGDYPYNNCTAVDGTISAGGGMEYPNITVIGNVESAFQLDLVIAHEVGHNWFYGILGTNERIHPWMDEGINSFYENRYIEYMYPDNRLLGELADKRFTKVFDLNEYKHKKEYELIYLLNAVKNEDQPIELPAYKYTTLNYAADVYSKTAIVFDYLMAYLGEKEMDEVMQKYFDEWRFKHPTPADLRKVVEETTGKNLSWFFDDLIRTNKKIDYRIGFSYQDKNDGTWHIGVKNKGQINSPIFIYGIKNNKLVASVMYDGFKGNQILDFPPSAVDRFKIDYLEEMPLINRNKSTIRTTGLFRKVEPLKLQFLASLDNPDKTQLFFTPVVGWNDYDKFMFGMLFHNVTLPQKKFEYELMPMYSPHINDIAGYGKLTYNIYPNQLFRHISIGVTSTRYAYASAPFNMDFNKLAPELNIEFKKKDATSPYTHAIRYRNITIIKDVADYTGNTFSSQTVHQNFNDLTYSFSKKDGLNPYSVKLNLQQGQNILKTSVTVNYTRNFRVKNKGVDARFFAGTFLGTSAADAYLYRFRLSGQTGYQDYLYDNIYLGRSQTSGTLANQFTETDGAFKFFSTLGQTSKSIAAFNIKSSLGNLKLPVNVFADIGMTGKDGGTSGKVLYDAGLYLPVVKNIFEIYFPLLLAQDFKNYETANHLKYIETVRFTLNLNLANPFDLIKKLEL